MDQARRVCGGRNGFTLVELIIVIIILGILAALAIPQFSTSTKDAKEATLKGDLAVLRNAINLYYHEHNSQYPGALKVSGDGTATSDAEAATAFVEQLTQYTNKAGKTSETKDPDNYPYGPYIVSMPVNPLPNTAAVSTPGAVKVTDDADPLAADTTANGWVVSKKTGQIIANNSEYVAW